MSNKCIGAPVVERQWYFLSSGDYKNSQSDRNEILFRIATDELANDGTGQTKDGVYNIMINFVNIGESDSNVYVKVSSSSEQPTLDPWNQDYGQSGFKATFTAQKWSDYSSVPPSEVDYCVVKPLGRTSCMVATRDSNNNLIKYFKVGINSGSPVKIQIVGTTHVEQLS